MAEGDSAEHLVFGQFLSFGLDHQHAFRGASDDEVELALLQLFRDRVEHIGAIDEADAGSGDRAEERNAGQREGGRAADHRHNVRIVLQIVAEHGGDNLDFIAEAMREERTDRTVDQAAGEHFLLGRTTFTLEEAARDLAGSEGLFLIVDRQREEILPRLRGAHAHGGAEHHGLTIGDEHGAIGLTGDLAGLEDELAAAPVEFLAEIIEHVLSFTSSDAMRDGTRQDRVTLREDRAATRATRVGDRLNGHSHVAGGAVLAPLGATASGVFPPRSRRLPRRQDASGAIGQRRSDRRSISER